MGATITRNLVAASVLLVVAFDDRLDVSYRVSRVARIVSRAIWYISPLSV